MLMIAATFSSTTWTEIGSLAAILLVTLRLAHVPVDRLGRNLLMVSWLALFTMGVHVIGENGAGQSLQLGLQTGGIATARLLLIVGWGTALAHSSSPLMLVTALEQLLSPLKRLGIPIQSFSLVGMLSLRFLPILIHEQQMLVRTYIARGIDIPHEPRQTRLRLYVLMCVPLFTHLLRRVEHLSAAMESRGFQVLATRTVLYQTHLRPVDYALVGGSVLVLGGMIVL